MAFMSAYHAVAMLNFRISFAPHVDVKPDAEI